MTPFRRLLVAGLLCSTLLPASAALGADNADEPPVLSLTAGASREVANDEMSVTLRVERQSDQLAVANRDALGKVNTLIETARAVPGVDTRLANVGSNPIYSESKKPNGSSERRITGWHAYADATLKSRDVPALSKLVGELSGQARILSIGFSVSKQVREKVESELIVEAAKAFNERAATTATALGFKAADIRSVNVAVAGQPPVRPVFREAMSAMAAKAAPVPDFGDAAGESTIAATASGQVWLRR